VAAGVGPGAVRRGRRTPVTATVRRGRDGTVLTWGTPPEGVLRARVLLDEGRTAASRTDHHHVTVYLLTATGPDAAGRLGAELVRPGRDFGAAGDADTVARAVRRLTDAGADTVVLTPTADEPDPDAFVRFAAENVWPLVP
jgi:alkanesulfonate monooxygenase SsuD/methylene tetrahydromethanopterin reductase-like flavin-dependent oxidoreductase (luciferase family)